MRKSRHIAIKSHPALWSENRFAPEAFQNRQNFFGGKNVTAIVLEVPCNLIGRGVVHAWATASLYGHAPEVQVSRWGLPMITHILLSDPSLHDASENYNRGQPIRLRYATPRAPLPRRPSTNTALGDGVAPDKQSAPKNGRTGGPAFDSAGWPIFALSAKVELFPSDSTQSLIPKTRSNTVATRSNGEDLPRE
jgi:hypothetical protein